MKNPELKLKLHQMLKQHDWSYQFADDNKAFTQGQESFSKIKSFIKENKLEKEVEQWLLSNKKEKSYFN